MGRMDMVCPSTFAEQAQRKLDEGQELDEADVARLIRHAKASADNEDRRGNRMKSATSRLFRVLSCAGHNAYWNFWAHGVREASYRLGFFKKLFRPKAYMLDSSALRAGAEGRRDEFQTRAQAAIRDFLQELHADVVALETEKLKAKIGAALSLANDTSAWDG